MRRNDDSSSSRILETDQMRDNFVHGRLSQATHIRLLSLRCHEAQSQKLPNQDYARIIYRQDTTSLCFCVCDGVGSSYKGDFAAHYIATHLVDWLHNLSVLPPDASKLGSSLQDYLNTLAAPAQSELAQLPLPANIPPLVEEVLTELRTDYGSETVFLCGRLDYDSDEARSTQSLLRGSGPWVGRAFFGWMGNVSCQLFTTPEHSIVLGDATDRDGRWSTLRGCRGPLRIWSRPLSGLDRLLIYTDGFGEPGSPLFNVGDDEWSEQVRQLFSLPAQDDITALALHWQSAVQ